MGVYGQWSRHIHYNVYKQLGSLSRHSLSSATHTRNRIPQIDLLLQLATWKQSMKTNSTILGIDIHCKHVNPIKKKTMCLHEFVYKYHSILMSVQLISALTKQLIIILANNSILGTLQLHDYYLYPLCLYVFYLKKKQLSSSNFKKETFLHIFDISSLQN